MLKDPNNFQSSVEVNKYFDEIAYFNKCFKRLHFCVYSYYEQFNKMFTDLMFENGPDILHVDLLSMDAKQKYWLNDNNKYKTAKKLINITQSYWDYLKKCWPVTPMPLSPTYLMKPFTDNY